MAGQGVELNERVLIQQHLDALAGSVLTAGVLLFDGSLTAGCVAMLAARVKIGELAGGGAQIVFLLEVLGHYSSFLLLPDATGASGCGDGMSALPSDEVGTTVHILKL